LRLATTLAGPMDHLAFLLPSTMILFAITFLAVGWSGPKSARAWGLAFLFGALGFIAPILPLPFALQSLLANAAFLVSFYCYGDALLLHFRAPRMIAPRIIFALLAYAMVIVAVEGFASLPLELTVADISVAILLGVPLASVIWRAHTLPDRVLVAVAGIVVLDIIVRLFIFNVLVGISPALSDFAASSYAYYNQVAVGVLSVGFALAAMGSIVSQMLAGYRSAAERDPLTGLLNRRGFDAVAAPMTPMGQGAAILLVDVDRFKLINDDFGHEAGDLVLAGLADILRSILPGTAVISRFGGEEFAVLIPRLSMAEAGALAHGIRLACSERDWRLCGVDRLVTLCVGVSLVLSEEPNWKAAFKRADSALYAAKDDGRDRVMFAKPDAYLAIERAA